MENKKTSIVRNYLYNATYQLLVLLAPLITTPYISRVLGVTGISIYSFTQSIASYFILISAVGTTLYGQREIAYVQDNPKRRTEVFWQITFFRFVTVGISTLIYFLIFGFEMEYTSVYRILALQVIATAFDVSWFFMGMEKFKVTVIRNAIIKFVGIVLVFILVKKPDDILLYTFCMTFPIFIGNISLWFSLSKYLVKCKVNYSEIKYYIKPIIILFLPQLATEAYLALDKTMLGALATNIDEVGYYTQASKIVKIVLTIVTSLGIVMLPAMSFAFAKGDKEKIVNSIRKAFQFVFMLGFALLFGLLGIVENFVPIFFGEGYNPVITLIIVISPIIIFISMSNVIGKQYLLPTGQQNIYTLSVIVGSCFNFVLNFILIEKFNAIGASIATVLAELSVTLVQAIAVRKQINLLASIKVGVKYLVCGIIMGASVFGIGKVLNHGILGLGIQIFIGVVIYFIELVAIRDPLLMEGKQLIIFHK